MIAKKKKGKEKPSNVLFLENVRFAFSREHRTFCRARNTNDYVRGHSNFHALESW